MHRSVVAPTAAHGNRLSVKSKAVAAPAAPAVQQAYKQESHTRGLVRYVKPTEEELYTYIYELPAGIEKPSNVELEEHEMPFTDLRQTSQEFNLHDNGFVLVKLQVPQIDWDNEQEVQRKYYPLVEELLRKETGASRVHIFDHTLRRGAVRAEHEYENKVMPPGAPVPRTHVDYTEKSGVERLNALLPDEADELRQTPFAVVQVWRPLRGPVEQSPLGMIDGATVVPEDYHSYRLEFPGRTGYNYAVSHNPNHRWVYTEGMKPDEAYIFVCYDSRKDGRVRFTPHTGLKDLNSKPDAAPRESVELRSYCFWQ